MDNKEMLLCGGGDPYAQATHWVTVGQYNDAGLLGYGFSIPGKNGSVTPTICNGAEIYMFEDQYNNTMVGKFTLQSKTDGTFVTAGNLRITVLDTGAVISVTAGTGSKGLPEYTCDKPFGFDKFVGKTVAVKIEVV